MTGTHGYGLCLPVAKGRLSPKLDPWQSHSFQPPESNKAKVQFAVALPHLRTHSVEAVRLATDNVQVNTLLRRLESSASLNGLFHTIHSRRRRPR
jgi:hypothetical protein